MRPVPHSTTLDDLELYASIWNTQ